MLSQADDLLKAHSIPELRLLQDRLHKEANGKKQELQSMVGSKYNDFIQSADAISIMRTKSELMGEKLASFFACSQALVSATNELLNAKGGSGGSDGKISSTNSNGKNGGSTGQSAGASVATVVIKLSDAAVWALLERCDVYRAGLTVQLARLLLRLDAPAYLPQLSAFALPAGAAAACRSVAFLQQTVAEDARLLLLLPGLGGTEKAQTLAALGLLSGAQRGELLQRFLQGASLLLDEEGPVDDDEAEAERDGADDENDDDCRLSVRGGWFVGPAIFFPL